MCPSLLYLACASSCSLLLLGRIQKRPACHHANKRALVVAIDWTAVVCCCLVFLSPQRPLVRVDGYSLLPQSAAVDELVVGHPPRVATRHCVAPTPHSRPRRPCPPLSLHHPQTHSPSVNHVQDHHHLRLPHGLGLRPCLPPHALPHAHQHEGRAVLLHGPQQEHRHHQLHA